MAMFLDQTRARILANSPLCETCSVLDLDQIFREGVDPNCPISLGALTTILSKKHTCGLCRLISLLISRSWRLERHPTEDLTSVQVQFYATSGSYADLDQLPPGVVGPLPTCAHRIYLVAARPSEEITRMVMNEKIELSIQLQMMEDSAARFGRERAFHGRRVDSVVSIKRIKEWMRICEEDHGATCANVWRNNLKRIKEREGLDASSLEQLPQGTKMIDVKQLMIVEAPEDCIHQYVALSYVWGNSEHRHYITLIVWTSTMPSLP
jgi:hypothetical protein